MVSNSLVIFALSSSLALNVILMIKNSRLYDRVEFDEKILDSIFDSVLHIVEKKEEDADEEQSAN